MSRSGYVYEHEMAPGAFGRWRGVVASALRGKRGRRLLRDLADGLDAMTDRRLIVDELNDDSGSMCALGAAARHRELDVSLFDPYATDEVASAFDIAEALAREVVFVNDEGGRRGETSRERWLRVRLWVAECLGEAPEGEAAAYAAGIAFRAAEYSYNLDNLRQSSRRWRLLGGAP